MGKNTIICDCCKALGAPALKAVKSSGKMRRKGVFALTCGRFAVKLCVCKDTYSAGIGFGRYWQSVFEFSRTL